MELTTTTFFSFQTRTFTSTATPATPSGTATRVGHVKPLRPTTHRVPVVETVLAKTVITFTIVSVITLDTNPAFKSIGTGTSSSQPSITPPVLSSQPSIILPSQSSTFREQAPAPPSSSTQPTSLPTDDSSGPRFPANAIRDRKLAYILPAVFLPLLFACILAYTTYRRRRRKLSWQNVTVTPIAFETSSTTGDQHLMRMQNDSDASGRLGKYVSSRGPYHDESANHSEVRDIGGNNGVNRDGRVGGATIGVALERSAGADSNDDEIPVMRAELLDLRVRLGDIEARQVAEPPPCYY